MKLLVICSLCIGFAVADDTYRAGVLITPKAELQYVPLIQEAGESNVDIFVLTAKEDISKDNYDEIVKTLSKSAKAAGLYLIASLNEIVQCQNKVERLRYNMVYDREGNVIVAYRKSYNSASNCTSSSPEAVTFTTDFGVTFGLFMEEDPVLRNLDEFQGVKNFVVTGSWSSEIPFFSAAQFSPSWAFVNNANVIFSSGMHSQRNTDSSAWTFADLKKDGLIDLSPPVISPANIKFPDEDLSQYIIRPLNLEASSEGYKEIVCHNTLCCEFYVKTSYLEAKQPEVNYGLAAFDGQRLYGHNRHIGAQNCALFACAGQYKRSCAVRFDNSTNITFDKVTITGNFTKKNSAQFPMLVAPNPVSNEQFEFNTKSEDVSTEVTGTKLLSFGIVSRV